MDAVRRNRVRLATASGRGSIILGIPSRIVPDRRVGAAVLREDNAATVRCAPAFGIAEGTAQIDDVWEAGRRVDEVVVPALAGAVPAGKSTRLDACADCKGCRLE